MPIQVRCPTGHKLNVSSKRAGTQVLCPACRAAVEVPLTPSSNIEPSPPPPLPTRHGGLSGLRLSSSSASPVFKLPPSLKSKGRPKPARIRRQLSQRGAMVSDSAVAVAPPLAPSTTPSAEAAFADFSPQLDSEPIGFIAQSAPPEDRPLKKKPRPANKIPAPRVPVVRRSAIAPTPKQKCDGYIADAAHRQTVNRLATAVAALAIFTLLPALGHWNLLHAPGWAQIVFLLVLVQLAYAAWLALAPDWSTVWVTMLALAGLATIYAAALAISLHTVRGAEAILNLSDLSRAHGNIPAAWCITVVALASLLAYVCGRTSFRWHKSFLVLAGRRK